MRVLHLTDLHLLKDPDERLKNVPTRQTLADVMAQIRTRHKPFDHIAITGDLAHDELRETYASLRTILGEWLPRCRFVPGNHDDRQFIREVFPEGLAPVDQYVAFAIDAADWRFVGIDTHWPGEVSGRIDPAHVEWLREELARHQGRPTAIFMHHPPISIQSAWLDRLGLADPEPFRQLIQASPHVKLIACGHVHQAFEAWLGQARVLATPSTALQFEAGSDVPRYDALPPGYRIIEFDSGNFTTRVERLPFCEFEPVDD